MRAMKSFFAGFGDFLGGFGLVLGVGSIRKWALIPMALNALLFAVLAVLVFLYAVYAVDCILGQSNPT